MLTGNFKDLPAAVGSEKRPCLRASPQRKDGFFSNKLPRVWRGESNEKGKIFISIFILLNQSLGSLTQFFME